MIDLLELSPDALQEFVEKIGQKPYRARQLSSWIFEKAERDFARKYLRCDGSDIACDLIRLAWSSVANTRRHVRALWDPQSDRAARRDLRNVRALRGRNTSETRVIRARVMAILCVVDVARRRLLRRLVLRI